MGHRGIWSRKSPIGSRNFQTTNSVESSTTSICSPTEDRSSESLIPASFVASYGNCGSSGANRRCGADHLLPRHGPEDHSVDGIRKQRRRERAEVDRAIRVMESCIAEGHIGEDEDE